MQMGHLMQMAQRKRQHEREEASEQEGEDEEYSEEEEEEYFEEGEEEERSFDPKEEASECTDDSRVWSRRSMYKRDSFRRPRQARMMILEASESDDSRDWKRRSRYKHAPPPPPPPLPYTPVVSPGFWFGHTHQALINGPAVAGRWISARNQVWQEVGRSRPGNLPKLFHEGGRPEQFRRQALDRDHLHCLASDQAALI